MYIASVVSRDGIRGRPELIPHLSLSFIQLCSGCDSAPEISPALHVYSDLNGRGFNSDPNDDPLVREHKILPSFT